MLVKTDSNSDSEPLSWQAISYAEHELFGDSFKLDMRSREILLVFFLFSLFGLMARIFGRVYLIWSCTRAVTTVSGHRSLLEKTRPLCVPLNRQSDRNLFLFPNNFILYFPSQVNAITLLCYNNQMIHKT